MTCTNCLITCPGGCECSCHGPDAENVKDAQMDFGSLDQIMMMMMIGGSGQIDKKWPIERQANTIAQFYAQFLEIRLIHEREHVTKQRTSCPFCIALKLSLSLNREKA